MYKFLKKSSINFCELDYIYSIYIAEFYNTLSGIFLCFSSILFYYRHIKTFDEDFSLVNNFLLVKTYKLIFYINFLLFIVGIGTILFHSQLLYIFQLIDEIPMLLIIINYLNLLEKLYPNYFYFKNLFIIKFQIITISIICISGFVNDTLQVFLFQGTMILCVINYLVINNKINNSYILVQEVELKPFEGKKTCQKIINYVKEIKNYNKFCLKITILSFSLWLIEQLFCEYVQKYYFHAFWHFLSSIGMYYYNYIMLLHIKLHIKLNLKS